MLTTRWPEPSNGEWSDRLRLRQPELPKAWSEFLGRVPWEWFVTLTFDPKRGMPVGRQRAAREAFWWCAQTGRLVRRPIGWVYAPERGKTGMWHVHALLTGGFSLEQLKASLAMWRVRNGLTDIRPVISSGGIVLYTTKQAALTGEVVLSDTFAGYRNRLANAPVIDLHPEP